MHIAALVEKHGITIEVRKVYEWEAGVLPVPYTLHYAEQSLRDEMLARTTLTAEYAIHALFLLAEAKDVKELKKTARQAEKKLQKFFGPQYQEFLQAFLQERSVELAEWEAARQRAQIAAAEMTLDVVSMELYMELPEEKD